MKEETSGLSIIFESLAADHSDSWKLNGVIIGQRTNLASFNGSSHQSLIILDNDMSELRSRTSFSSFHCVIPIVLKNQFQASGTFQSSHCIPAEYLT
jgi:hypothetical protein